MISFIVSLASLAAAAPGPCKDFYDGDNDGIIDRETLYVYSGDRLIRKETDYGADGRVDTLETFEYDAESRLVVHRTDLLADGTADASLRYAYDAKGKLLELIYDLKDDGKGDDRTAFEYHANGLLAEERVDFGIDGKINEIRKHFYDSESGPGPTRTEYDIGNDGVIDSVTTYEYETNRLKTSIIEKLNSTDPKFRTDFFYDADGKLIERKESRLIDGQWLLRATQTYDFSCKQSQLTD